MGLPALLPDLADVLRSVGDAVLDLAAGPNDAGGDAEDEGGDGSGEQDEGHKAAREHLGDGALGVGLVGGGDVLDDAGVEEGDLLECGLVAVSLPLEGGLAAGAGHVGTPRGADDGHAALRAFLNAHVPQSAPRPAVQLRGDLCFCRGRVLAAGSGLLAEPVFFPTAFRAHVLATRRALHASCYSVVSTLISIVWQHHVSTAPVIRTELGERVRLEKAEHREVDEPLHLLGSDQLLHVVVLERECALRRGARDGRHLRLVYLGTQMSSQALQAVRVGARQHVDLPALPADPALSFLLPRQRFWSIFFWNSFRR